MTARFRARFLCGIAGAVLLFSACASTNTAALQSMSEESGRFLASGEVERALDPFTEAYRKNPGDKSLILHYTAAVEGIWQAGAEAFAKQDYAMAERIYRALWDHYPNFESFASRLTFTKSALEEKLKQSRTSLADDLGQSALKSGDYAKALEVYQAALKDYPDDKALILHYIAALERIWLAGAEAFAKQDYAMAERIYHALWDDYPNFEGFVSKPTFTKSSLEEKLKQSRASLTDGLCRSALKSGDYGKALEVYQAALKDYPGDKTLLGRYAFAANQIMAAAIKASAGGNHAPAGKAYYLLLRNYASFEAIRPGVTFTRKNLTDGISVCRANLKNVGLTEYRKGNFAKAIAVWESLLAFDPGNAEVKKAVETAKTQQKELLRKK